MSKPSLILVMAAITLTIALADAAWRDAARRVAAQRRPTSR